jgi:large subunit ribosomal protein L29
MKMNVIKEKTVEDLTDELERMEANLSQMQLSHTVSPLEDPLSIRNTRRTVARIKTELHNRELEANKK